MPKKSKANILNGVFNPRKATKHNQDRQDSRKAAELAAEYCGGCPNNPGIGDDGFPLCDKECSTQFIFAAGDITTLDARKPEGCVRRERN